MNWKNRRLLFLNSTILVAAALYFILTRNDESNDINGLTVIFVLLAFPIITIVNSLINTALDKYLPWGFYKVKRFFIQIVLGLFFSLAITNILYFILKSQYTHTPPEIGQIIVLNLFGAAIIIPIISVFLGIKFLKAWNESQLEAERLQKENARSQMMSLRNHLDPHFLFNNLNILSSLIDHDIKLSKEYLEKFAEVYRTILRSELSDLITLKEEMNLVEAYNYLIKIRWQDAVDIIIDLDEDHMSKVIPPLSIQMLLENVIKHNTISKSNPIEIKIQSIGEDLIEVINTKRIKKYGNNEKSGTGLMNIQNRYAYFTDQKISIKDQEQSFSVQLPLLTIE